MRIKLFLGSLAILIVIAGSVLPVGEIVSSAEFKFFPDYAKQTHFFRLTEPKSNNAIYLLGTIHGGHFESSSHYPYQSLRSVLENLKPDLLLVEIRPQAMEQGLWGEGPPEMPYAVAMARRLSLPVKGMDYWKPDYTPAKDFDDREDHMFKLIQNLSDGVRTTLVLTGFSHIQGIKRRLIENGFVVDESFNSTEKMKMLSAEVSNSIPQDYVEAISKVILKVEQHRSDYTQEWAQNRRALLKHLQNQNVVSGSE